MVIAARAVTVMFKVIAIFANAWQPAKRPTFLTVGSGINDSLKKISTH
jgi:hypothetical protein